MIEEILPNLYRTEIPLPNNPLKSLNSYIVKSEDRFLVIDTGFNREECLEAMHANMKKLGVDLKKTDFFITHFHSDHIGLTGRLVSEESKVYFGEWEAKKIYHLRESQNQYWESILKVYAANGFTNAREALAIQPLHQFGLNMKFDFTFLHDGDVIDIGDYHFRCFSAPGHTPGQMNLYEPGKKILVAGDNILFDITPNITYWVDMEDSLSRYLASLERVAALDVDFVLTGHRRLVHDLKGRVRELQAHHRLRLNEVMEALKDGEKDVLQIAPYISWNITARNWDDFPLRQKWFAFGETLAHVLYLEDEGKVQRSRRRGKILYSLT